LAAFLSRERIIAPPGFNRWLVPPAALAIHLSIGMAYGFSVFWLPLGRAIGITASAPDDWKVSTLGWMYTLFFVMLGSSAAVFGPWLEREGPRKAGVVAACWWWSRRHRLHLFDTVDFIAPLVPPGLGFGRLGNYIGGELWGKPTEAGWGVVFPRAPEFAGWSAEQIKAEFATGALDKFARHPSQLYQAVLEGLVMFVVLWWFSSRPRPRYAVAGMFALLYGCIRFLVEFVRVPDQQIGYLAFNWLTMGQVLSLPLIALGLFWLGLSRRSPTLAGA
jgi:hypothetical protein